MFISHFNRYFEKHARITYIVLLVIIIATFVIFVTPGDVFGRRDGRLSDFGTLGGKTLKTEATQEQMAMIKMMLEMNGQQVNDTMVILEQTVMWLRLLREAKAQKLDNVTDAELKEQIRKSFSKDGKFDKAGFDTFLENIGKRYGIQPGQFDQFLREQLTVDRLLKRVRDNVKVPAEELDAFQALYTLKIASFPVNAADTEPSEKEIADYFAAHRGDLQLPARRNAVVAVFRTDEKMGDEEKAKVRATAEAFYKEIPGQLKAVADGAKRQSLFEQLAKKATGTVLTTGILTGGRTVKGLAGDQLNLTDAIRRLETAGDLTPLVTGNQYYAVAMLTEKSPNPMPVAMNDEAREAVRAAIVSERAYKYFDEKLEPDFKQYYARIQEILANPRLNDQMRFFYAQQIDMFYNGGSFRDFVEMSTRDFALVTFPIEKFMVAPTTEALNAEFNENKEKYQKVTVRLARLSADIAGLEGEALKGVEARLEKAVEALKGKADYKQVAKDCTLALTEDGKPVDLEGLPDALKEAASSLTAKGQFSGVVEENGKRVILVLLERLDSQPESQLRASIKAALTAKATAAAEKKAGAAADAFFQELEKVSKGKETAGLPKLMERLAAKHGGIFGKYEKIHAADGRNGKVALAPELLAQVFSTSLTLKNPLRLIPQTVSPMPGMAPVKLDAPAVVALVGMKPEHLVRPAVTDDSYQRLVELCNDELMMGKAEQRAKEASEAIAKALKEKGGDFKAAAGAVTFADLAPFSLYDLQKSSEAVTAIQTANHIELGEVFTELMEAKEPGVFLKPLAEVVPPVSMRSTAIKKGYKLLYVAERKMPADSEELQKQRKEMEEMLLQQKQQQAVSEFLTSLEQKYPWEKPEQLMTKAEAEAAKADAPKAEPAKSDASKAEPAKSDASKAEAAKSDASKAEPAKK